VIEDYVEAVRAAVAAENWFAALPLALTLPDICGWLEDPSATSRQRYVRWFDRFLLPTYSLSTGAGQPPMVFLSGNDCYALRCAFLHEGRDDVSHQEAQEVVQRVFFTRPGGPAVGHMNRHNDILQLEVGRFCEDVCVAVIAWQDQVANRGPAITARMNELLAVRLFTELPGFGSWVQGPTP